MKTSFWTRLLDVIQPRRCAVCGARLSVNERLLCAPCHLHLPVTGYENAPLDNPMARIFWGQFPVERAAALFYYRSKSDITQIIFDLKYRGHPEVAELMGELTARKFAPSGFFDGIDAIVPMPITKRRQWQRGYNQCMKIAEGVSIVTGLPVYKHIVKRTAFNKSQTTLSKSERHENVEKAFLLLDTQRIAGKHLLLIDDVITTGATLTACGRELAKAEGVKISILTLGMTKA